MFKLKIYILIYIYCILKEGLFSNMRGGRGMEKENDDKQLMSYRGSCGGGGGN